VVRSIAERIAKIGHRVCVLTGEPGKKDPSEEDLNGVHVIRWPTRAPNDAYHVPVKWQKLEMVLQELASEVDVIHIHNVHAVLPVWALSKLHRVKARKVLTMHYHRTGHSILRKPLWSIWRPYLRRLLRYVDVVHAVSQYEASLIRKDFGVAPIVVEHGVEEEILTQEWGPENYVLYAGRLEKYKNVHKLIRVIKAVQDSGVDVQLKIVGEGRYKRKLEALASKLRIEAEFLPFQPRKEYVELLSRARAVSNLSSHEAYSLFIHEATAMGVPAIVAEPWGRHFANRRNILLVKANKSCGKLSELIASFLINQNGNSPPSCNNRVPTWNKVREIYFKLLYSA